MRALDAQDIVRLWETCASLHPIDRVLAVLRAGSTDDAPGAVAALPIGERERLAVALRIRTFGPAGEGANACPACGLVHEIDPPLQAMLAAPVAGSEPLTLVLDGHEIVARSPDSYDQAALTCCADQDDALRTLIVRCVLRVSHGGEEVEVGTLPPAVVAAVAESLARHDPNAETLIRSRCVGCDHPWTMVFDAGEFLWAEVAQHARRLLYEVHTLARAYHWSERDILSMSAQRREAYLDLVGA